MAILEHIKTRLMLENNQDCKMFWCIPCPTDDSFEWQIEDFDSQGDDLSNWMIIIHKLKHLWKKDFDQCRDKINALPRGVVCNNTMFHGNNTPVGISDIASKMNLSLGDEVTPRYNKRYGVKDEDLSILQNILGLELGLDTTDF